ncbi:endoglucanase [Rivularia sp. PCC 7116]|uniref:glycoside hydrolase family 5 protein n=1 Tax=Rivularia sp. PCC 7116 TaxID=373994 RepID=UPI00029F411D|nr:cellulase family glycosylhydrolase [Rivularia sp. PCC 7116]AFY55696.1 endoglucanase [Rivularia sp. PCC 7116]
MILKKKAISLIIIFTVTLCLTPILNLFVNENNLLGFNNISNAQSKYFQVHGTKIVSPEGREFIPIGANINGWNFMGWDAKELGGAAKLVNSIQNDWNFNIVRATVGLKEQIWQGQRMSQWQWSTHREIALQSLDKIVAAFTNKKIVVMLEAHDWTCSYPQGNDLLLLNDFWKTIAERYKTNPYVWFNIINEPGVVSKGKGVSPEWVKIHQEMIRLIRDRVGAKNPIVVDADSCGQDSDSWDLEMVDEKSSAILHQGYKLKFFDGKSYENIIFSLHVYDLWAHGNKKMDAKFIDYLYRVQKKGHALLIGEVGNAGENDFNRFQAPGLVYRNALPLKIGMLAWHFQPGDKFGLVSTGNRWGSEIDSQTNPSNLTKGFGEYFWPSRVKQALSS